MDRTAKEKLNKDFYFYYCNSNMYINNIYIANPPGTVVVDKQSKKAVVV